MEASTHWDMLSMASCSAARKCGASSHIQVTIITVSTYTSYNHHCFHIYKPQLSPFPQNHAAPRASAARHHIYKLQSSPFPHIQASIATFLSWIHWLRQGAVHYAWPVRGANLVFCPFFGMKIPARVDLSRKLPKANILSLPHPPFPIPPSL